jgi:DNA repair exonuclease SbcCD ATPase subunit
MRLKKLTVENYGPYKSKQTICFPEHGKIAVVGENGAGKSFLFDAIPLALFGTATNRPKGIYELFNDSQRRPVKKGLLEIVFEIDNKEVVIKRLIDSINRKQVATLHVDGVSMTEGKVSELLQEVSKLGLNENVFLTSAYASQNGSGHLIGLSDIERRGVFECILQLDAYNKEHLIVKEALRSYEVRERSIREEMDKIEIGLHSIDDLKETLSQVVQNKDKLSVELNNTQNSIRKLQAIEIKAQANKNELDRLSTSLDEAYSKIEQLKSKKVDNTKRIENNKVLLKDKDKIEQAVKDVDIVKSDIEKLLQDIEDKRVLVNKEERLRDSQLQKAVDEAQEKYYSHNNTLNAVRNSLSKLERDKSECLNSLKAIDNEIVKTTEIKSIKKEVPCLSTDTFVNTCPLLKKANNAEMDEKNLKQNKTSMEIKIKAKDVLIQELKEEVSKQERLMLEAQNNLNSMKKQFNETRLEHPERSKLVELDEILSSKKASLISLEKTARFFSNLQVAKERIKDNHESLENIEKELTTLNKMVDSIISKIADASELESSRISIENQLPSLINNQKKLIENISNLAKKTGELEATIKVTEESQTKLKTFEKELKEIITISSKLKVIEEGLGPKGAPALKVDAAGPEITTLINDLLLACYGNRFSCRLDTQKENKSNDRLKEVLQLVVIDNESGDEAPVENLSGGEQAIVKEAISLGLAVFARRHCGVDIRCLIRDETTAPLSDDNGERYIQMLDRALAVGGFDQVLYVSHKPSLQAMADHCITVDNGVMKFNEAA